MQVIVEGWRFLDRSYGVANQFQLLEMLDRPEGEIFHRALPYIDPDWQTTTSLFDRPTETLLHSIPSPSPNQFADVTLRMSYPWNFAALTRAKKWVFAPTEWVIITQVETKGENPNILNGDC